MLFAGPENEKLFFEEDAIEILPRLYVSRLIRSGPACIKEILQGNSKKCNGADLNVSLVDMDTVNETVES